MLSSLIAAVIGGAIIGALARAVLPGAQDIGMVKTVGLGVVASIVAGLVFGSWTPWFVTLVLAVILAAGLLWFAVRQGWVKPSAA
jgi:uncharacterized membrane protein YeaQ/YmgE (transglycosylase-associated protein family)